jgi:hypothetical protein
MHYNVIRDAVWGTTLIMITGILQPVNTLQAVMCYIGMFVVLVSLLETAREWECKIRKRRNMHGNRKVQNRCSNKIG